MTSQTQQQSEKSFILRGELFSMLDDPSTAGDGALQHYEDGAMVIEGGEIAAIGPASEIIADDANLPIVNRRGHIIMPGMVDTHIHYPQTDMIASYGSQLLEWLETYTFPTEAAFADSAHSAEVASVFLDELLSNGTTTALVFGSVHKASCDALFREAHKRNMRIIAGKALMDSNVPDSVRDTAESSEADNRALIKDWHGKGRLGYAVTPRFAPACSSDQMRRAANVLHEHKDVLMQTHLSENVDEINWVKDLFPGANSYLDVYAQHGLLTDRSIFAHCIHISDEERRALTRAGAAISFCPTSNLFLGSGLFDVKAAEDEGVKLGMGTDVGAGTSFSMLSCLNEGYKISQLRGHSLDPLKSFYMATLGGARALNLGGRIGSFELGKEADFLVLDPAPTRLMGRRLSVAKSLHERLFVHAMLGDDRAIKESWVYGKPAYQKAA